MWYLGIRHAVKDEIIDKYLIKIKPDEIQLRKINNLRKQVGNCII